MTDFKSFSFGLGVLSGFDSLFFFLTHFFLDEHEHPAGFVSRKGLSGRVSTNID